jgi:hypothetical protein
MMKRGIALAIVALATNGALAAETAKQLKTNSAQAQRMALLKKKKKVTPDMTTTQRGAPRPLTKRQETQDTVKSSSSSATTSASLPGLTAGTSAANAGKVGMKKKSFVDNIRASAVVEFYGASVADPTSGYQTDKTTGYSQGADPIELQHHLSLGYQITENVSLSADPYFQTIGAAEDGEGNVTDSGSGFRYREDLSFFNIRFKKFVKTKSFTWSGGLRVYPDLGGERTKERPLYLRHDYNLVYAVAPRMNLAMYNTARYYRRTAEHYANPDNANSFDVRLTFGPTVEYQLSDSLGSYLSFVTDVRRNHRTGKMMDGPNDAIFFELGGSWDVVKRVNLNPYIDMYTNTPNIEAWQLGANLALTIL